MYDPIKMAMGKAIGTAFDVWCDAVREHEGVGENRLWLMWDEGLTVNDAIVAIRYHRACAKADRNY